MFKFISEIRSRGRGEVGVVYRVELKALILNATNIYEKILIDSFQRAPCFITNK